MRVRLRGPGGASTITLPDDATVGDLLLQIAEKTSVPKFDIKYGYPPKPLLLKESERSQLLKDLDVKLDGEQLTISPKDEPVTSKPAVLAPQQTNQLRAQEKESATSFSFGDIASTPDKQRSSGPVSLEKTTMASEVPEIPMPDRGATLGKISRSRPKFKYLLTCSSPSSHAG